MDEYYPSTKPPLHTSHSLNKMSFLCSFFSPQLSGAKFMLRKLFNDHAAGKLFATLLLLPFLHFLTITATTFYAWAWHGSSFPSIPYGIADGGSLPLNDDESCTF